MSKSTLNWLNRPASHATTPSSGRSGAHQRYHSTPLDLPPYPPPGTLGSGASVVRTPTDALRELKSFTSSHEQGHSNGHAIYASLETPFQSPLEEESTGSYSPPLPPLPIFSDTGYDDRHPPSPLMQIQESRVFLQEYKAPLSVLHPIPPLPSFSPHLSSDTPLLANSCSLITIETCTQSFRTTVSTLTSRPSHISSYLETLLTGGQMEPTSLDTLPVVSEEESPVVADIDSELDRSIRETYRFHLEEQGLVAPAKVAPPLQSAPIHIFLDRPSEVYTYILAYLRAPSTYEALPRAAKIVPGSSIELLLSLREEAAYLGLQGLVELCEEEMDLGTSHSSQHLGLPRKASQRASIVDAQSSVSSRQVSSAHPVEVLQRQSHKLPDTPQSLSSVRSLRSSRSPERTAKTPHSPVRVATSPGPGWF